jgi:transposase
VRYNPQIKRYYQRKRAKTKGVVATKAVAHKLARACYHILRDGSAFDVNRAFA